jgi:DNA-binding transcriptional ArsR family regulator
MTCCGEFLVSLLAQEQLCTCHLADATGALPSAVSNQLRHLREAGIVEREAVGRYGTALLVTVVVGSGIAATNRSPGNV